MKNYKSNEPCITCGISGDGLTCYHHELSRGAANEHRDNPRVMFSLCARCHGIRHAIGQSAFIKRFPQYEFELIKKGWKLDPFRLKWVFISEPTDA